MKKISFLIFISVFCSCSLDNTQKAKKLIDHELKVTLHDYHSYEPVEFEKLDSTFSKYDKDPSFIKLESDAEYYEKLEKDYVDKLELYARLPSEHMMFNIYKNLSKQYLDTLTIIDSNMTRVKKEFKPHFTGWDMIHTFRSKNLSGNFGISHFKYYFDSALSKVLLYEDISEKNTVK